jgi:glycosyltransferase involved in cell wall biosynthesis
LDSPKLSILLPTVENRCDLFALLHAELKRQTEGHPEVELVVACDAKQISIGKKRQNLLETATGDYVCYIDDDDWISKDYVTSILEALQSNPDCVGFEIHCTKNGGSVESAVASMKYPRWGDNQDGYRYVRSIYHKTPVRRAIALQAGFPNLRYAEDKSYSTGVQARCKTEVFIKRVLYYYRYRNEPFSSKYGISGGPPNQKGIVYDHVRKPFQH